MGGNTGIRILTVVGSIAALLGGARTVGPAAVAALYVAAVTVPLVVSDVRERRLPNALVLPGYAFAGVGLAWEALARGSPGRDGAASAASVAAVLVAGTAVLGLFLLLVWSGGLGMGDAKLAGLLAITMGAGGLRDTGGGVVPMPVPVLAWVAAVFLAAALHGGVEWLVRREDAWSGRREVAFGPAMLGAFWMVMVAV